MAKNDERMQEITAKLQAGVQEVFSSGRYAEYLQTMAKFPRYSYRNTLLIHQQNPAATRVAGFGTWKGLGRSVKRGEKGLLILAPTPYKQTVEVTRDKDGNELPQAEQQEITITAFKPVFVFDVSQTQGKELPSLAQRLAGDYQEYEALLQGLRELSPYPIDFLELQGKINGYCSKKEQRIVIRSGLSQQQTIKTGIHELAHALLGHLDDDLPRETEEVQAESVAYIVCQHLGIDSSQYTFGYVAAWSAGKELAELQQSLAVIQQQSTEIIYRMDAKLELLRERASELAREEAPAQDREEQIPAAPQAALILGDELKAELLPAPVSQERIAEMEESFWAETNDPETEEWREDLTPEEQKLVDRWEDDFEQGLAKMMPASRKAQERNKELPPELPAAAQGQRELTGQSTHIPVAGHQGTWHTIDTTTRNGQDYFLMEHDQYGDEAASVILDKEGNLILEDVYDGFDDLEEYLSEQAQVIGTLTYLDSGEVLEYSDSDKFVADYRDALDYMGPNGVRAKTITHDVETHYHITAAGANEFGYEVDRDLYYQLAEKYGFDQPWPTDVMYYGTPEELAEYKEHNRTTPQRLFVDMDGTLAEFSPVDRLESLYEYGYFANLKPLDNVVAAIREIHANHPEIEVHILSSYLSDSPHAQIEKNQWLDEHLPGIDAAHRIFVPCGESKADAIEDIRDTDYLLDDYTTNLSQWEPPARGIKLLNGINHTKGTWQGDRVSAGQAPEELAAKIISVMTGQAQALDIPPQEAILQEPAVIQRFEYGLTFSARIELAGQSELCPIAVDGEHIYAETSRGKLELTPEQAEQFKDWRLKLLEKQAEIFRAPGLSVQERLEAAQAVCRMRENDRPVDERVRRVEKDKSR